jgi:hypothetical protein
MGARPLVAVKIVTATWMAGAAYAVGLDDVARALGLAYASVRATRAFPRGAGFAGLPYLPTDAGVRVQSCAAPHTFTTRAFERVVVARIPRVFPDLLVAAQDYFEQLDPELVDETPLAWEHWLRCKRELGIGQWADIPDVIGWLRQ